MNTVLGGGKEKQCQEMKDQITGRLENADSENAWPQNDQLAPLCHVSILTLQRSPLHGQLRPAFSGPAISGRAFFRKIDLANTGRAFSDP